MLSTSELLRSYFTVWNERDDASRLRLLQTCWADDGALYDHLLPDVVRGRDAVNRAIGEICAKLPADHRFARVSEIQEHQHGVRYTWGLLDAQGEEIRRGEDIVERDDEGRIVRLVTFPGRLADLPAPV